MTASLDCRNEANVQLQTTGRGAPGCFQVTILREARDGFSVFIAFNLLSGGGGVMSICGGQTTICRSHPFFSLHGSQGLNLGLQNGQQEPFPPESAH